MDPCSVHATPSAHEEDEWDTEGFVIPSLDIGDPNTNWTVASEVDPKPSSPKDKKEEKIYLGPHGAPPQSKQQELNSSSRKQGFKQKLKGVDRRITATGQENKLENLLELVGGDKVPNMLKGSPRDWLYSHCHESPFEKRSPQ